MSRLYKKCFLAAGGMHVLLVVILVVCPAFLASNPKPVDILPIKFIPDILIPAPFSGGGRPDADRPAARTPAAPAPAPLPTPTPPAPQPKPKIKEKEVALPEIDNSSLEVAKDNKPTRKRPEVTTVAVVRKQNTKPRPERSEDTTAEDNQARERLARNRLAAFDRTLGDIRSGTGTAATFEGSRGPGGGGPSYASYAAYVLSVFDSAWIAPQDATSEDATAEARVTIASDGTIVSKRIIKRSGDAAVDASVQRALDRVDSIGRPFPEGMKEKEHTYIIPFNTTKHGTA